MTRSPDPLAVPPSWKSAVWVIGAVWAVATTAVAGTSLWMHLHSAGDMTELKVVTLQQSVDEIKAVVRAQDDRLRNIQVEVARIAERVGVPKRVSNGPNHNDPAGKNPPGS